MAGFGRISGKAWRMVALCLLVAALAGCNSSGLSLAESVRTPPRAVVVADAASSAAPVRRDTGNYPVFTPRLTAAAEQIGDEDYQRSEQQLTALSNQRRNGQISEAEYRRRVEEYRRLAAGHGKAALADIAP